MVNWDKSGFPAHARVDPERLGTDPTLRRTIMGAMSPPGGDPDGEVPIPASGRVDVYFVTGYNCGRNSVSWYAYAGEPPAESPESTIIFPNAIRMGRTCGIPDWTCVTLTGLPGGGRLGFVLHSDAFDPPSGLVKEGRPRHYSHPRYNPGGNPQCYKRMLGDDAVLYFEDISLDDPACDADYTDCVLLVRGPGAVVTRPPGLDLEPVPAYVTSRMMLDSGYMQAVFVGRDFDGLQLLDPARQYRFTWTVSLAIMGQNRKALAHVFPFIRFAPVVSTQTVSPTGIVTVRAEGPPDTIFDRGRGTIVLFRSGDCRPDPDDPETQKSWYALQKFFHHLTFDLKLSNFMVEDVTDAPQVTTLISTRTDSRIEDADHWLGGMLDGLPLSNQTLLDL